MMKKGRPGHTVSALVDPALVEPVRAVLQAETGSLGVRGWPVERWPARREMGQVDVDGLPVRVKVSAGRVKVEQADAARVAARSGRPLREVLFEAEAAWRARRPGPGQPDDGVRRPGADAVPEGPEPA
jgi:uncharacterized protein (DUF111 family)